MVQLLALATEQTVHGSTRVRAHSWVHVGARVGTRGILLC